MALYTFFYHSAFIFVSLSLFGKSETAVCASVKRYVNHQQITLAPFPWGVLLVCWGCPFGWQEASEAWCSTFLPAES